MGLKMGFLGGLFSRFEPVQVYTGGVPRSSQWPKVRAEFLAEFPACFGCALIAKTNVPHHLQPFHEFPHLELDKNNLVTVCTDCHFVICHLRNFRLWNPHAKEDLAVYRERFLAAREGGKKLIGEPVGFLLGVDQVQGAGNA